MKKNSFGKMIWLHVLVMIALLMSPAMAMESSLGLSRQEVQEVQEVQGYWDVPDTHPHFNEIHRLRYEGIMAKDESVVFRPGHLVTRLELAEILTDVYGMSPGNHPEPMDVPVDHHAYEAVAAVLTSGWLSLDEDNRFRPDEPLDGKKVSLLGWEGGPISRGEMARLIYDVFFAKTPVALEVEETAFTREQLEEPATVGLYYALKGLSSDDDAPFTRKHKARFFMDQMEQTVYPHYEYYRSMITDTSNRDMLQAYAAGLIQADEGKLNPDGVLTVSQVLEVIQNPAGGEMVPERPVYQHRSRIPLLMYHEIDTLPPGGPVSLYISRQRFSQHLDGLLEKGYHTVTMEQVYQHWKNQAPLPENPIVLTFDDGYRSHREYAAVELANRGMTGTFYVMAGERFLHNSWYVTEEQLREMHEMGMEIGNHTLDHRDLRSLNRDETYRQIHGNQQKLEEILGVPVNHFCYPYGGVSATARAVLSETGHRTAVTTVYGAASAGQGWHDLRRIRVDYTDTASRLLQKIR